MDFSLLTTVAEVGSIHPSTVPPFPELDSYQLNTQHPTPNTYPARRRDVRTVRTCLLIQEEHADMQTALYVEEGW
jgi:hypothetical protein